MDFHAAWKQLNEIFIQDFNTYGNDDLYYHFYQDLADLLNSLNTKTIYSTKNDEAENIAQFDHTHKDWKSYVCMTSSVAGKKYMTTSTFDRPFGLAFSKKEINTICDTDSNYSIDAFSAFGEKGNYKISSSGIPQILANTAEYGSNGFYIYSIGQLDDDTYFVCGGQSVKNPWPAQMFKAEELYGNVKGKDLYAKLRSWFMSNMNSTELYQQKSYYYFTDGYIGKPLQIYKEKPIHVSGNKNSRYQPRKNNTMDGFDQTISFDFKGSYSTKFKEVLGYGPINVYDNGTKILELQYVTPTQSGYRGPSIFGKNLSAEDSENNYNDDTIRAGQRSKKNPTSVQQNFFASKDTFGALCKVFNENEHRIYIKNGRDFSFEPETVLSIVLPELLKVRDNEEFINLKQLTNLLKDGKIFNLDSPSFIKDLIDNEIILRDSKDTKTKEVTKKAAKEDKLSKYAKELLHYFIKLFQGQYKHVNIEFIPNNQDLKFKTNATIKSYLNTGTIEPEIAVGTKISSKDKTRKILSNSIDSLVSLNDAIKVLGEGKEENSKKSEYTTVAPIKLPNGDSDWCRLGSEAIITAVDDTLKPYVLFVYKAKSATFMELPGGGFRGETNITESSFEDLIRERLSFKCNLSCNSSNGDIDELITENKGLLLHEEGVALNKTVIEGWKYSYYRLFSGIFNKILTTTDLISGTNKTALNYSYDNSKIAAQISKETGEFVKGYNAYMRWLPVKDLIINRSITDRYADLIPLIEERANDTVKFMKSTVEEFNKIKEEISN